MSRSIVLFSSGIDSTTALYWALAKRDAVHALTFDYGQRHKVEVRCARHIARRLGVPQTILKLDLAPIGGSALTDRTIKLPRYNRASQIKAGPPVTYVPFRNGILIALAAAWAETRGFDEIICGFHTIDSPDYPDTRPEFVRAMERAVNAGTKAAYGKAKITLAAPFVRMKKSEIIRLGLSLGADYSASVSCYAGGEHPCGACSSCHLRRRAFAEAGATDPLVRRLKKRGRQ
jgi:7-cyano-7-deazaguanine synthase